MSGFWQRKTDFCKATVIITGDGKKLVLHKSDKLCPFCKEVYLYVDDAYNAHSKEGMELSICNDCAIKESLHIFHRRKQS